MNKFFAIIIIAVIFLSGCQLFPNKKANIPPDIQSIVADSSNNLIEANSLHFLMEISGRPTYLDIPPTLALKYVEGDINKPSKMQALVRVFSLGLTTEVAIKEIEGEQFITNPLNQQWERVSSSGKWYFDPTLFFDSEQGVSSILLNTDWIYLSIAEEEKKGTYMFEQVIPGEYLVDITSWMIREGQVKMSIWILKDTHQVSFIRLIELDSDSENPTVWHIELSDYNQEIEISMPEMIQ